jgi:hypothetical protein
MAAWTPSEGVRLGVRQASPPSRTGMGTGRVPCSLVRTSFSPPQTRVQDNVESLPRMHIQQMASSVYLAGIR